MIFRYSIILYVITCLERVLEVYPLGLRYVSLQGHFRGYRSWGRSKGLSPEEWDSGACKPRPKPHPFVLITNAKKS